MIPDKDIHILVPARGCGKVNMIQSRIKDFMEKNPDKKIVVIRAGDLRGRKKVDPDG